jgi:hypothetical protein
MPILKRSAALVGMALMAVFCPGAADASVQPDAVIVVAASTPGGFGANFRTALQLTNPGDEPISGWIAYSPQGTPFPAAAPAVRYELAPHATYSIDDVVASLGSSGLGTLDFRIESGGLPVVVARAYDDQGERGTTGVVVPLMLPLDAHPAGRSATLLAPQESVNYRFNIGVRTFGAGAALRFVVRNAAGVERHSATREFPENYFEQRPAAEMTGTPIAAGDSVSIEVASGSAIVYGTTTDNRTNDSSLQVAVGVQP